MDIYLLIISFVPYEYVLSGVTGIFSFIIFSLIYYKKRNKIDGDISGLDLIPLILGLIVVISLLFSFDPLSSFVDSLYFLNIIPLYYILLNLKEKERLNNYLYISGVISAIISIIMYLLTTYQRLEGLFNYANASALFYSVCIIIYFFVIEKIYRENPFYKIGSIILITSLFLTQSRGALFLYISAVLLLMIISYKIKEKKVFYTLLLNLFISNLIGIIISILLYYRNYIGLLLFIPILIIVTFYNINIFVKKNNGRHLIIFILVLALGAFAALVNTFGRLKKFSLENPQLLERFLFYKDGIKIVKDNPFGIGAGSFLSKQFMYQSKDYYVRYVHNGFLQYAIDFGLIFLIILLVFLVLKIYKGIKNIKENYTYLILILMILLHSLVDFSMSFLQINIILMILITSLKMKNREMKFKNRKFAKFNKYAYKGFISLIFIICLYFAPLYAAYNVSINLPPSNYKLAYNILNKMEIYKKLPWNYYEKKSLIAYNIYLQEDDEKYFQLACENINKSIEINPYNKEIKVVKDSLKLKK